MSAARWLAVACLALAALLHPHPALAYSCSAASPGTQSFGNVSPVSGSAYSISGTITVTCTVGVAEGLLNGTSILACLSITGASGSTPRSMTNGSNSLQYNLYSDAAHTQIWGAAASSPPSPVAVSFNLTLLGILLGGSSSQNVSLYGYVPANQTTVPAALYSQALSGSNAIVNYIAYTGTQPTCSSGWASGGSFAFTVSANVINDCNIAATNVNFGSSGVLGTALTATGTITAQCTSNDSYSIALNAGTTSGATLSNREMLLSGGSATVNYQLYTGSSHSSIWGDGSSGTSTNGGTATGSNQTYTVYGLVPAQTTPVPGSYADTVTATITY